MANSLNTNPIVIDTFSGDVTITTEPVQIDTISFTSSSAGDIATLDDKNGNLVYYQSTSAANGSESLSFDGLRIQGLTLDVSDGTYAGTARLLIYLK
jgi:hypothetical protein